MARIDTFTLRVNRDERRMLAAVAERLQRTQSDAVRLLIREAARELIAKQQPVTAVSGQGGDNADRE
jgi:uncharacterized protein (DUF1778 family)